MSNSKSVLLVSLGILLVSACPQDPVEPEGSCQSFHDCAAGQLCTSSQCQNCADAEDCQTDYGADAQCQGGRCISPDCPDGQLGCGCAADSSCAVGECVDGLCVDCQRGDLDCVCFDNGSCAQGLRCTEQKLCENCPAGELNCACPSVGDCADGLICDNGVCTTDPCPSGTTACPCEPDDLCDESLYCDDNSLCQSCSTDIEGCPCDAQQSCQNDLVCDPAEITCREPLLCAQLSCSAHQLCQERSAGLDASCLEDCDTGFRWNSAGCDELSCEPTASHSIAEECEQAMRTCVPQSLGGAICGACLVGYTDLSGSLETCRAFLTCTDLDCPSLNRECIEGDSSNDASCDACIDGFTEGSAGCVEANCVAGSEGSLVESCATEFRSCTDPDDGVAHCGDCLQSYSENTNQQCQAEHSCDATDLNCLGANRLCAGEAPLQYCGDCIEGTIPSAADPDVCVTPVNCAELDCGDDFCIEGGPGESASCISPSCGSQQAYSAFSGGCVDCDVNCSDNDGETGRIWPITPSDSTLCICETANNFFWDVGDRQAQYCDADGDGWVRSAARVAVESSDQALRENARCHVRTIDRFVLQNELKQRKTIYLCQGPEPFTDDPAQCATPAPLALYETWRNDDQNRIDNELNTAPAYQQVGVGRRFRANEINGLTRACINEGGDFNNNGKADISEWHGMSPGILAPDQATMLQFSYFIELHRAWYETRPDSALIGQYVIAERSRCAEDFVLGYPDGSDPYWRSCTRSRDVTYDTTDGENGPEFGLDFARWSCADEYGSCPIPPPPTEVVADAEIPQHDLCRTAALPASEAECHMSGGPWPCVDDQVWRGMNHSSQFRCVKLRDTAGVDLPTLPTSLFASGDYAFNTCHIACPDGDPNCATDCSSGSCVSSTESALTGPINPSNPKLICAVDSAPQNNAVGFAASQFKTGPGPYQRGCIDEWAPTSGNAQLNLEISSWRSLCPGWNDDPVGTIGQGIEKQFGKLACGCGLNYGGLNCDIGCPDAMLNHEADYSYTPRSGYWMCADFATSAVDSLDSEFGPALVGQSSTGSQYIIRDDIGLPQDEQALCEFDDDCHTGFVIR